MNDGPVYALITGGSSGIGRAIAFELAKKSKPLLLVALDNPALYMVADRLRRDYDIPVHTLAIDLSREEAPQRVFDWCQEHQYPVNILVNNAGFGRGGSFSDLSLKDYYNMIALNNRAMVGLSYLFLPELKRHSSARILNLSSMEAALPLPYKTVYASTKNFVYTFSLALREELRETNIWVTAVCPGPTLTNASGLRRIRAQGRSSRILLMKPHNVAKMAVDGMLRGKSVVVPGKLHATIFHLATFLHTGTKMRLLERLSRKFKEIPG